MSAVPTTIAQVSYEDEAAAENSSEKDRNMEEAADSQSTSDSASEPDQNTLSSGEQSQNTSDENPTGGAYRMAFLSHRFSFLPLQQL